MQLPSIISVFHILISSRLNIQTILISNFRLRFHQTFVSVANFCQNFLHATKTMSSHSYKQFFRMKKKLNFHSYDENLATFGVLKTYAHLRQMNALVY